MWAPMKSSSNRQPIRRASDIIVLFAAKHGSKDADELAYISQIAKQLPPDTINLAGRLSLSQSACLLSRAKIYVGPDTVMTHIAAAVGVPTVALFGPSSSLAKYLAVEIARKVTTWAADIFGAASVIREHPIHKFPMDAWASSLGEGTQDVQKLVIFRELMKHYG